MRNDNVSPESEPCQRGRLYLLDGVQLDRLAETAARLNRWEFLLVVAPPQVPGSTGAVVNPLAMF